ICVQIPRSGWNGSKRGYVYKFLRSEGFVSSYDTTQHYTNTDAHMNREPLPEDILGVTIQRAIKEILGDTTQRDIEEILGDTTQRDIGRYYPKRYWEILPKEILPYVLRIIWSRELLPLKGYRGGRYVYKLGIDVERLDDELYKLETS
ncbi:hypothetical protein Tco_1077477, partial [Tanacetum coccineum]